MVIREVFVRLVGGAALPKLCGHVESWHPDVIVRETQEYASAVAGPLLGVPVVRIAIMLGQVEHHALELALEPLQELRDSAGLPPDPTGRDLHAAPCYTPFPLSFEEPGTPGLHQMRRVRLSKPLGDSSVLPAEWWPGQEGPIVYVTFGSIAGSVPGTDVAFRAAVEAAAGLDARVLLTTGHDFQSSSLGAIPDNVHVEPWVPQHDVFAHASAVLCHGGSGTVTGALAAGLPLAVLPLFADQPQNCERVAATGVGLGITDKPPSSRAIASTLQRLLEDGSYRRNARVMANEIESHLTMREVVQDLEKLASAPESPVARRQ